MKATKFQRDAFERIVWTMVQAAVAVYAAELGNLDPLWIAPVAATIAAVKAYAARRIGDADSAATLPAYIDAAAADIATKIAKETVKKTK